MVVVVVVVVVLDSACKMWESILGADFKLEQHIQPIRSERQGERQGNKTVMTLFGKEKVKSSNQKSNLDLKIK